MLKATKKPDEDVRYGKGKQGDELPAELRFREQRLKKIQEAKLALVAKARQQAPVASDPVTGQPGTVSAVSPQPKAQRNFTDTDSRVMGHERRGEPTARGMTLGRTDK
jgi:hypothetical protein